MAVDDTKLAVCLMLTPIATTKHLARAGPGGSLERQKGSLAGKGARFGGSCVAHEEAPQASRRRSGGNSLTLQKGGHEKALE